MNLSNGDRTSGRERQRLRRGLGRRLALYPRSRHVSLLRITCVTCHVSRVTWPVHRVNVCMQVPHSGARHRGPRSSPGTAAPGIRRWQTCARHDPRCLTMLYNTSDKFLFLATCNFLSYIGGILDSENMFYLIFYLISISEEGRALHEDLQAITKTMRLWVSKTKI